MDRHKDFSGLSKILTIDSMLKVSKNIVVGRRRLLHTLRTSRLVQLFAHFGSNTTKSTHCFHANP